MEYLYGYNTFLWNGFVIIITDGDFTKAVQK